MLGKKFNLHKHRTFLSPKKVYVCEKIKNTQNHLKCPEVLLRIFL